MDPTSKPMKMFKDPDERVIISFNLGYTIQNIQYNYTGSKFCQIELKKSTCGMVLANYLIKTPIPQQKADRRAFFFQWL